MLLERNWFSAGPDAGHYPFARENCFAAAYRCFFELNAGLLISFAQFLPQKCTSTLKLRLFGIHLPNWLKYLFARSTFATLKNECIESRIMG
jgi:hypothetical protein